MKNTGKYQRIGLIDPYINEMLRLQRLVEENGFYLEIRPTGYRLSARTIIRNAYQPILGLRYDANYDDVQDFLHSAIQNRRQI